ncbi:hypothetical protein [Chitinophaga sp. CF418]|nr:hypothetical protein [Chitinophaga sp. CF418]SHN34304.1 hypothetical protein SAMN05216311_109271 [Chitinophaga sp. CF418]
MKTFIFFAIIFAALSVSAKAGYSKAVYTTQQSSLSQLLSLYYDEKMHW